MDLLQRTYELIDQSPLSQRQIAAGAGVGREWFAKFSQRRIPSPGVTKVQAVYDFLRSKKSIRARDHAA
jgi:predicted XRE-type DNA-binding protein